MAKAYLGDPMSDETLTLRPELVAGLDELAASTGRARDELIEEAVARYLDYERWAMARIREGVRQAEAGELASEDEVERVFGKYRAHASGA